MEDSGKLVHALDLMRRLPREKAEQNVADILTLNPNITEEVLATVDLPSIVLFDGTAQKPFLLCDYNRDGDSYRFLLSRSFICFHSPHVLPPLQSANLKVALDQ